MLSLYSGTPGSGKSLHAAGYIYTTLKNGFPVVANFPINTSIFRRNVNFKYVSNADLNPGLLVEYSREWREHHRCKEGDITLIIDEAQIIFNSRTWQKGGRQDWLRFFSEHRKYFYDIILISQFDRMLDTQIRCLIEYEYQHRKASNFGFWGKLFALIPWFGSFCAVKVWLMQYP